MIIKKQRELRAVVKALGAQVKMDVVAEKGKETIVTMSLLSRMMMLTTLWVQVEAVLEESGEVRSSLARLEAAAREGGRPGGRAGGKYQGGRRVDKSQL